MIYYDIGEHDLGEMYDALLASGCPDYMAQRACMVLSSPDKGYTYTNFIDHLTVMFIGKSSSLGELYDTIQHEMKHAVEHIGEYYGVDSKSEESAYLQGEIARQMFPAVALVVCPMCHSHEDRTIAYR